MRGYGAAPPAILGVAALPVAGVLAASLGLLALDLAIEVLLCARNLARLGAAAARSRRHLQAGAALTPVAAITTNVTIENGFFSRIFWVARREKKCQ